MYRVGVDLGGMSIKAGLIDAAGNVAVKGSCKTQVDKGYHQIIKDMAELIRQLMDEVQAEIGQIQSIGIGIPGTANVDGFVYYVTNLKWMNVPMREILSQYFPNINIFINNDANVAALAEYHFGAMQGYDSGIMITLGTGVGGGLILDGRIRQGAFHTGGEIGHMVVGDNFYNCNCGNNGCLETFCSASAIIKYAQKLIREGGQGILHTLVGGNPDNVTAKMIFQAYSERDELAEKVIDRFIKYLAIGMANLVNIFDPQIFVIGGGVSLSLDLYREKLMQEISRYLIYKDIPYARIVGARFNNDAGFMGAAMLGKE